MSEMEDMNRIRNTIFVVLAFGFFFFGDIISTFLVLKNGGYEMNRFLAAIGFNGFVIFKILMIIVLGSMIYYLDKWKFYKESGIILGMILMSGLLATLFNLGFFK
jgi:Domain of unknown function (DUF5658)